MKSTHYIRIALREMLSPEICKLAAWYVDKAAELTSFTNDLDIPRINVVRKNALLKMTRRTVAHFLGAGEDATGGFSLFQIQNVIIVTLNRLDDPEVQKYYSLVEKILSKKMRNCITEYIASPPSWMVYSRLRGVNRRTVCTFWNEISDGRAYPSTS